jgi:DNA-binding Lrp family transcriptional regulator
VLLEVETGAIQRIAEQMRGIDGVRGVDSVTGPYDLIVQIETDDPRGIGRIVIERLHSIAGVLQTITCLTIDQY